MSLYSVLGFSVLHMPTHLVLTNDSPEISRPPGWWTVEKGIPPPQGAQGAAPEPGGHPIPVSVQGVSFPSLHPGWIPQRQKRLPGSPCS